MTDRELDALLSEVRAGLSIAPSREFAACLRADAASRRRRRVAPRSIAPAAAVAAVMGMGLWWTIASPRPQEPLAGVSAALPRRVEAPAEPKVLAPRVQASRASLHAASTGSIDAGNGAIGPADGSALNSPDASVMVIPEPPAFTIATFTPVEPPHVATFTVEPTTPFIPVQFPVVQFPVVEVPRVNVTLVEFPLLPITPGTPLMHPGKEMP